MKTSEKVAEIAAALAKAQGVMRPAAKDSANPAFKGSKYADLAAVWESIREPLSANGISVLQDVENHGQGVSVTTRLQHSSGEFMEFGPLVVPLSKADAHGVGSATTYARRFALSAAVGVVADADDDGNGASGKDEKGQDEKPARPQAVPPPEPKAPDYPVISEEQAEAIRAAAKKAGIKSKEDYAAALVRFSGVNDTRRIAADKYEHVIEQFSLVGAPVPA